MPSACRETAVDEQRLARDVAGCAAREVDERAAQVVEDAVAADHRAGGHRRDPGRIGKYRPKNGYKKHTGFRASLSEIKIESIGGAKKAAAKKSEAAPAKKAEKAPKAEAAAPADDHVKGMPSGYEDLTVAQIKQQSADWNRPMLEAALEYEQAHGKRKGAVAAIESALSEKESD